MFMSRNYRFSLTSNVRTMRVMEQSLALADLDGLARTIDQRGIDAVPATLIRSLADEARTDGASTTLTTLIVDPAEPRVARERAFVKLGARVTGARSRSRTCTRHAA